MKRMVLVGGVVALGLGMLGLGGFQAASSEKAAAIAAETNDATLNHTPSNRDIFHFSDVGFRFVTPEGFIVVSSEEVPGGPSAPVQHLEVWERVAYYNRTSQPEAPPVVHIRVFENTQGLPLEDWKGDLSEAGDRPITVAGQEGLTYSATGLYEADNVVFTTPDGRYVIRIRGEYMGAEDDIRNAYQTILKTFAFDLVPGAQGRDRPIDYSRLQQRLAAQDWQGADLETRAIFYRLWQQNLSHDFYYDSPEFAANLPCEDVQTIDRLWSAASQGQLGLQTQQQIWESIASQTTNPRERVERFGETVGWRQDTPQTGDGSLNAILGTSWKLETDLDVTAPIPGQFPWAGISSDRLQALLTESGLGCGSCTVDAMYLAAERYYDYLPALFARVDACTCNQATPQAPQ